MTTPQPLNNPRIPKEPHYNRRRYDEQRNKGNIQRAIGLLASKNAGPEPRIVKMYQAAVAGAIIAAEEASAVKDAASPT